ncbi:ABC-type Fe3+ transport system substrate-binding protein [Haloferula luteola]|uniref:ABC-type Fe3+ transport system substrate-binding protein n=1 Tax=Haloferula luteola TaxID=595692 RepID=A0A840V562_9BACT|nr:extracellular solute-binding protein [Haloferula luteola]MBB5349928.1 ABC-type Fe3+ transport system substrate-binding protein [Haloferula luteola]
MIRRILPILVLLAVIVAAPLLLRRDTEVALSEEGADRLVVVTPHNESIRREFGEAFAAHWKAKTGRPLFIDWRSPAGGGEILRVLDAAFSAAKDLGKEGTEYDIFFGGGEKDFRKQADLGRLAKLEVFSRHPEWFADTAVPAEFTGQTFYDADHRWVGVCVSQFGILYNTDALAWIDVAPPTRWDDLRDPAYFGRLALADPTMSSSVMQSFEMMIQEQMQKVLREQGDSPEARQKGWENGMMLILNMGANARYFSDSSSKIPHDVALGDAAAGTTIDFYGRTMEEIVAHDGHSRLKWIAPSGGTPVSVDPVGVFRGAPHGEVAQEFVEFCLSEAGQVLWNQRAGSPGGPQAQALRRLPVRRDLYTPDRLQRFSDPDAMPFERAGEFVYQPELTGAAFNALRIIIKSMCIAPHEELKRAWEARVVKGGEEPASLFVLGEIRYETVMKEWVPLVKGGDKIAISRKTTDLSRHFKEQYEAIAAGKEVRP